MTVLRQVSPDGLIIMRPVLFRAPTWWTDDFWSTHAYDDVEATAPLSAKPTVELEVTLDTTLAEVIDAASDSWGLRPKWYREAPHPCRERCSVLASSEKTTRKA